MYRILDYSIAGFSPPEFKNVPAVSNIYYYTNGVAPFALEKSYEPMENCLNASGVSYINSGYYINGQNIFNYNAGIKQECTTTTSIYVPNGVRYVSALLIGGGGGGGGGGKGDSRNNGASGGGGGGGACSIMRLFPVTPGKLCTITIGGGGAGGGGQWTNLATSGNAGGTTIFTYDGVDVLSAAGGSGGGPGSGANVGASAGAGATGSHYSNINDWNQNTTYVSVKSNNGGTGLPRPTRAAGGTVKLQAGTNIIVSYGGGGSGGIGGDNDKNKPGESGYTGATGYCRIYWFGGLP